MRKPRTDCLKAKKIIEFETSPERVEQILLSAGSSIGSVHFYKRKSGELRKMAYRLDVTKPKYAKAPTGDGDRAGIGTVAIKDRDKKHNQLTVFDVNKIIRDKDGNIERDKDGKMKRGAYRMVPLDQVVQITIKGLRYVFNR